MVLVVPELIQQIFQPLIDTFLYTTHFIESEITRSNALFIRLEVANLLSSQPSLFSIMYEFVLFYVQGRLFIFSQLKTTALSSSSLLQVCFDIESVLVAQFGLFLPDIIFDSSSYYLQNIAYTVIFKIFFLAYPYYFEVLLLFTHK